MDQAAQFLGAELLGFLASKEATMENYGKSPVLVDLYNLIYLKMVILFHYINLYNGFPQLSMGHFQ
jgi:hypothetical protein